MTASNKGTVSNGKVDRCNKQKLSNVFWCVQYKAVRSCHLSVLRMNQTEEFAKKRVSGLTISYDNVVGK